MPISVIDFQVSDICSGGGHGTITMRKDGSPIGSIRTSIEAMKEEAVGLDPKKALWNVALEMLRLSNPSTLVDVKNTINSMTITVEF